MFRIHILQHYGPVVSQDFYLFQICLIFAKLCQLGKSVNGITVVSVISRVLLTFIFSLIAIRKELLHVNNILEMVTRFQAKCVSTPSQQKSKTLCSAFFSP